MQRTQTEALLLSVSYLKQLLTLHTVLLIETYAISTLFGAVIEHLNHSEVRTFQV